MANVEDIKQQLAKAEKELEEAKTAFEESKRGQQLKELEEKELYEELNQLEERVLARLRLEKRDLEADKREHLKHVEELQLRVTAAQTTQTGNNFVTWVSGT